MKFSETILALLLSSVLVFTLSACDDQGPMEEAGEEIDETVDESSDAIDDATDDD